MPKRANQATPTNLACVKCRQWFMHNVIEDKRSEKLTDEEAILLFTKYLPKWREENPEKNRPELSDGDPLARRIAMAIEHLRQLKRNKLAQQQ